MLAVRKFVDELGELPFRRRLVVRFQIVRLASRRAVRFIDGHLTEIGQATAELSREKGAGTFSHWFGRLATRWSRATSAMFVFHRSKSFFWISSRRLQPSAASNFTTAAAALATI